MGQSIPQGFGLSKVNAAFEGRGPRSGFVQQSRDDDRLALTTEHLLKTTSLMTALGVPPERLLQAATGSQPPPLPTPHVSRSSFFPILIQQLDSHRTVAVIGYPECGKSVAIVEFSQQYPADVFWFSIPKAESTGDDWFPLLCFSLAQFLSVDSLHAQELRSRLAQREHRLLIVLDDAHNCLRLDSLSFLFEAAAASPQLRVLLAGTDAPEFRKSLKERGIPDWRLPGLATDEARRLIERGMGSLNANQIEAIDELRSRVDGHVGMLKLSGSAIGEIASAEQLQGFIDHLSSTLGPGADSLLLAMIEQLRGALGSNEMELCRRLSLASVAFPRRVGKSLWETDSSPTDFPATWNSCCIRVLESRSGGRFSLPDLYRDGLQQEIDQHRLPGLHAAIADAFADRQGDSIEIMDVYATVFHRLLSGDAASALESASLYLVLVGGPRASVAQSFLISRFDSFLQSAANDVSVPISQRLRWFSIRARIYSDLDIEELADSATHDLYRLLRDNTTAVEPGRLQLAWTIVLMHASSTGDPAVTQEALSHVDDVPLAARDDLPLSASDFVLLNSYLKSSESPLDFVLSMMSARCEPDSHDPLWHPVHGYWLWRMVGIAVYSRPGENTRESRARYAARLGVLIKACVAANEKEIACVFTCVKVLFEIDELRSFQTAFQTSESLSGLVAGSSDQSLLAYMHDTRGDALRCSGRDIDAISEYESAIALWPDSEVIDKANATLMMAISHMKLGQHAQGALTARRAAKMQLPLRDTSSGGSDILIARCWLEAAAACVRGKEYPRACRSLLDAHSLLRSGHTSTHEWAAVAQIAWCLVTAQRPENENPTLAGPGFSMAFGGDTSDIKDMDPRAPTLMLARACAAVGRPHRSLMFFDEVLSHSDPEIVPAVATLALEPAIVISDLVASTRLAVQGCQWRSDEVPFREEYVFDLVVARTVQIALEREHKSNAIVLLEQALRELPETVDENRGIQLLAATLRGFYDSRANGNDSQLEESYHMAISFRALHVARAIAWYWCYRFALDRETSQKQYTLWHWRLCWLSMEIAPSDTEYLRGNIAQEYQFWELVSEEYEVDSKSIKANLRSKGVSPDEVLLKHTLWLAAKSCRLFDIIASAQELALQLGCMKMPVRFGASINALAIRFLDLALHPTASVAVPELRTMIEPVRERIADIEALSVIYGKTFNHLDSLLRLLENPVPERATFEALLWAHRNIHELDAESAAQAYVWLRHSIAIGLSESEVKQVFDILRSPHVEELLRREIPPYLRIRLSLANLSARVFADQRRLSNALATSRSQEDMKSPIRISAIRAAADDANDALRGLSESVSTYRALQAECETEKLRLEKYIACSDCGGSQQLVGSILLRFERQPDAVEWLRGALIDLLAALQAAGDIDPLERVNYELKAAFSGRTVARSIDDPRLAVFESAIERIRSAGLHDEAIQHQESEEEQDPLNRSDDTRDADLALAYADEEYIQRMTDLTMRSAGWQESRRKHVEDDARKMARAAREQHEYCRFLQPLQDLSHTLSPATVYASPTSYVCSCTLLGHETSIQLTDIDAVINGMKNVYCKECAHRSPGSDG